MTERDERDESRPKVRVVDKRRYRDGDPAEAEAAAQLLDELEGSASSQKD